MQTKPLALAGSPENTDWYFRTEQCQPYFQPLWTHPAVYHASSRYEAEEGFWLLDQRLSNAFNQPMQSAETYFHTTRHVESMEAGAVLSEATNASLCDLVWRGSFREHRPTAMSAFVKSAAPKQAAR